MDAGHDDAGGACAFNNSVDPDLIAYSTIMAPRFLTGDKAGIEDFLNKFDVRLDTRLQINNILTNYRSSSSTVMVRNRPKPRPDIYATWQLANAYNRLNHRD